MTDEKRLCRQGGTTTTSHVMDAQTVLIEDTAVQTFFSAPVGTTLSAVDSFLRHVQSGHSHRGLQGEDSVRGRHNPVSVATTMAEMHGGGGAEVGRSHTDH